MKFHKIFIVLFTVLLCMCCLCVGTVAHSGRTDSKGGHYDRSDGSYHYHHGYSAHDHYDMDGDGKKDCPYEFDDKTDHSANSSNDTIDFEIDDEDSVTFWDVLVAMLTQLIPAAVCGLIGAYLLSFVWLFVFGEHKGCLITWISAAVLFVCAYIWLVYTQVM